MSSLDVGALPVCDGRRLSGMITDRDITVRATAAGNHLGKRLLKFRTDLLLRRSGRRRSPSFDGTEADPPIAGAEPAINNW